MKMTAYNKLKIAILAVFASQSIHAITIDPIQVQSAPGELLYAEMSFSQANLDAPMQVSLASVEDLMSIGSTAQQQSLEHLNFFIRRNQSGSGVITITSSQPFHQPELNVILKVQEGNAAQIKRIKSPLRTAATKNTIPPNPQDKPLTPIRVVSEADIALNLPVTASRQEPPKLQTPVAQPASTATKGTSTQTAEVKTPPQETPRAPKPSVPAVVNPELLGGTTITITQRNAEGQSRSKTAKSVVSDSPVKPETQPQNAAKKTPDVEKKKAEATQSKKTSEQPKLQYVVQSKDSLWTIASQLAKQQNRPIQEVMEQIHQQNLNAFARGDVNRLQIGTVLHFDPNVSIRPSPEQKAPKKESVKPVEAKTKTQPSEAAPVTPKTKYKLNQAEMSLVAEKEKAPKQDASHKQGAIPEQLSLNVMTAREKSVKLQRNVTNLELALRKKDQRLQILNTRLAELQKQLQAQQAKQQPTS